jgi:hypothetical protein
MRKRITSEIADYGKWIKRMGRDERLMATHISLFTALFVFFQRNEFISPFTVTRTGLMACSRIASIATYHKCMKQLHDFGYIRYQPSFSPKQESLVYWPDASQAVNQAG